MPVFAFITKAGVKKGKEISAAQTFPSNHHTIALSPRPSGWQRERSRPV